MEYINRARDFINERLYGRKNEEETMDMESRMNAYLNFIYKVITWEDPKFSWMTFLFLNVLYILIIYYEVKFYCILFTSILFWFLLDFYGEIIDLKQHAKSISHKELNETVKGIILYLKALKRENPSVFCTAMVALFTSLSFIGRTLPGQLLSYIIILIVFFGPYLVRIIPEDKKQYVRSLINNFQATEGVVAETELIPYISNKFNGDLDPDQESLLTDKTQDSVTNSLISGLSTMPSHLEADCSVDELEDDDFLPHPTNSRTKYSAVEYSSDSDSEHNMEFDSSHFNRNSSSEDENFTKGLKFSDEVDQRKKGDTLFSNITNMSSKILSNLVQTAASQILNPQPTNRRDSDSDFEIINSDEAEDT